MSTDKPVKHMETHVWLPVGCLAELLAVQTLRNAERDRKIIGYSEQFMAEYEALIGSNTYNKNGTYLVAYETCRLLRN
jgi:hypothetical protein